MVIERFVVVAPRNGRGAAFGGTVLDTLPDGRAIESLLTEVPVEQLGQWVPSLNAALIAENVAKTQQLASAIEARNEAEAQLVGVIRERDEALAEVERLNGLLNPPAESTLMWPYEFIGLFTQQEQVSLWAALPQVPQIGLLLSGIFTVRFVDRASPVTTNGVQAMVQMGVLTQARAERILAGLQPE